MPGSGKHDLSSASVSPQRVTPHRPKAAVENFPLRKVSARHAEMSRLPQTCSWLAFLDRLQVICLKDLTSRCRAAVRGFSAPCVSELSVADQLVLWCALIARHFGD